MDKSLAKLRKAEEDYRKEVSDLMVEEGIALTHSDIGYFATFDPAANLLTMIGWSNKAMKNCAMQEKPLEYPFDATGLWGDCLRERQPVITNDYANSTRHTKKGQPIGHVLTIRHLNVPIWEDDKMVGILGVGNKLTDYTPEDGELLQQFGRRAWPIIKKFFQMS